MTLRHHVLEIAWAALGAQDGLLHVLAEALESDGRQLKRREQLGDRLVVAKNVECHLPHDLVESSDQIDENARAEVERLRAKTSNCDRQWCARSVPRPGGPACWVST